MKANYALNPEWNALVRTLSFRPGRDTVTGRTLLERQTVQIADITTDPEYALSAAASVGGKYGLSSACLYCVRVIQWA